MPRKAVLLSVDDGYKAGALAAPVFERYGFRAVYFVVPAVLGRGAFLSYGDLRALKARGFDIGSHTLTHPDLAKVPRGMDPQGYARWISKELGEPKRLLEAALGRPVTALAWPYGAYNPAVAAAALRLGYHQLWSVSGGLNDEAHLDPSRLRRLILMGHPSLADFARRMKKLPLRPYDGGIAEGSLIYRSQLPLRVSVPVGCEAVLGGKPVKLDAGHGFWLGRRTKGGFHYLNIAEEDGKTNRMTPFLFQIAPDAWKACFAALAEVGTPVVGKGVTRKRPKLRDLP
ncbi:MAG: polysaccharide deacetylase family protein [bacterium]